jgi:hypothetical protein
MRIEPSEAGELTLGASPKKAGQDSQPILSSQFPPSLAVLALRWLVARLAVPDDSLSQVSWGG